MGSGDGCNLDVQTILLLPAFIGGVAAYLQIHKPISSVFSDVNAVLMLLYCPGNFAETYSDERFSFKPMRCFEI